MNINLPEEFVSRMKNLLGDEYEAFEAAYNESNFHGLRINPLKGNCDKDNLSSFSLRPVPWCATGYYFEEDTKPGRHPYHHAGAYYIQEPSAMLVGELAAPAPGMKVLDLCAAPGGKTSHLAGFMMNEGVLVANEIVPNRAKILSQNVERMGIGNCIVTCEEPGRLANAMPGYFDLIVVDTPCSGEGMFRRDQIARDEWSPENVVMCGERGKDILESANRMLKYGGRLVYSTCTFAPLEDEEAIASFLNSHPEYSVEKVELKKRDESRDDDGWISPGIKEWATSEAEGIDRTIRLWPHKLHGEGHFVAVLKRGGDNASELSKRPVKNKADNKNNSLLAKAVKLYEEWAKKNITKDIEGEYTLVGDNLYIMPKDAPNVRALRFERLGLHLGEIKKDRFEPSHALALYLKRDETVNVWDIETNGDIEAKEAVRYLTGESINCGNEISGWCLITVDGYSLGWGKASNGVIKNHIPKGLRIKM